MSLILLAECMVGLSTILKMEHLKLPDQLKGIPPFFSYLPSPSHIQLISKCSMWTDFDLLT